MLYTGEGQNNVITKIYMAICGKNVHYNMSLNLKP